MPSKNQGPCAWPDGCTKLAKARGFCDGHYKRQKANGGFDPYRRECSECGAPFETVYYQTVTCGDDCLKVRRARTNVALRLLKGCARCGEVKPLTEYSTGGTVYCRPCFNEWRRENVTPETHRIRQLWTNYRLTEAAYRAMLAKQGGRCAICRSTEPGGKARGDDLSWAVDHDHSCCPGYRSCGHCVRGLLCVNCNNGLGRFGDDPARLRAASEYLERTRQAALFAAA